MIYADDQAQTEHRIGGIVKSLIELDQARTCSLTSRRLLSYVVVK